MSVTHDDPLRATVAPDARSVEPGDRPFGPVNKPEPPDVDRLVTGVSRAQTPHTPSPGSGRDVLPGLEALQPLRWAMDWARPTALNLELEVGRHRDVTLQVFNDDNVTRQLDSVYAAGTSAFTVHETPPTSIGPRSSASIVVRFEPMTETVERGWLIATADRGPGGTMSLVGRGTPRIAKAVKAVKPEPPHNDATSALPRDHEPAIDNAANTWKLAAPPTIDLGDHVVGKRTKETASIFALGREQGPRIRASLHGDPAIRLLAAPLYLPGAGQPYDETKALAFDVKPSRKGELASTLEIAIMDAPHETFRYPVVAGAHHVGGPNRAEEREANQETARNAKESADATAERARVEQEIAAESERDTHFHEGHKGKLAEARYQAELALTALYQKRLNGIGAAETEIGEFVRQQTIVKPSLLEQLAWMALDAATAGIAGGIAKRLEGFLTATFKVPSPGGLPDREVSPSKAIAAIFTDGLKETIKKSAKLRPGGSTTGTSISPGGDPDVGTTADGDTFAMRSENPKAAFFMLQRDALADESQLRANQLVATAHNALLPTLKVDPGKAIAAMKSVTAALAADQTFASLIHAEHSVRKWVRYVAETSSNDSSPNRKFDENHPLTSIDGWIDITIRADESHPEKPVVVTGARLNGVKAKVVERFAKHPLIKLDVPVRAAADFGSPSASLTVVRHSGGNVEYTENRSPDGQPSSRWLEQKAVAHGRGRDAEWGARILVEQEIMSRTLNQLVGGVDNDSKE